MSRSNIFARKCLACSHRALGFLASVEIPRLRFVAPLGMTHKRRKSAQARRGGACSSRIRDLLRVTAMLEIIPLETPGKLIPFAPYFPLTQKSTRHSAGAFYKG